MASMKDLNLRWGRGGCEHAIRAGGLPPENGVTFLKIETLMIIFVHSSFLYLLSLYLKYLFKGWQSTDR